MFDTVFVLVGWEHSVGCGCVANTVLAEFWANIIGDTEKQFIGNDWLAVSQQYFYDLTQPSHLNMICVYS